MRMKAFSALFSFNDNFLFTGQHCDTDTNYNGANLAQSLQMGQRKAHGAILLWWTRSNVCIDYNLINVTTFQISAFITEYKTDPKFL